MMANISAQESRVQEKYELHDGNDLILGKHYFDVSAKDPDSVDDAFKKFIGTIIKKRELE